MMHMHASLAPSGRLHLATDDDRVHQGRVVVSDSTQDYDGPKIYPHRIQGKDQKADRDRSYPFIRRSPYILYY